jgi:lactoylglutathione lyase
MIKIDHIAVYVHDLEKAKEFFEKYFHAQSNELYYNPNTGLKTYILSFDGHTRLELMTRPEIIDVRTSVFRNGYIHLSFNLGSKQNVDDLTQKMQEDGFRILSGPRVTGDGYYESCVEGSEGNLLELTV